MWGHRVDGVEPDDAGVTVPRRARRRRRARWRAQYVVGADGLRSTVRGARSASRSSAPPGQPDVDDAFLVVDVRADLPFPAERRFFFDPAWNPGRQVLLHPQPDRVWRIDWQVPAGFDLAAEQASGGVDSRIRAVIGDATPYEVDVELALHRAATAGRAVPRRAGLPRRRRRARHECVRRARDEQRHPGR